MTGGELVGNSKEFAKLLRVGEERRDASPSIKGFLFQDLLTIELILGSGDEDKIYAEWVEDIFVESPSNISVYQVKHYAGSELDFQSVYENMFYQFVKYRQLDEDNQKEFRAYCLYHAKTTKDYKKEKLMETIEKARTQPNKKPNSKIMSALVECSNMKEREMLVFGSDGCNELVSELCFEKKEREEIEKTTNLVKELVFEKLSSRVTNIDKLKLLGEEELKNVLLALSVQYVQDRYIHKSEEINERTMTRQELVSYIDGSLKNDESSVTAYIQGLVLGYIDEMFIELSDEIDEQETIGTYKKIYESTKKWLDAVLVTKYSRKKFLYFVSTLKVDELTDEHDECKLFTKQESAIASSIKQIWKVLFDINCSEFGNFINEEEDYYYFKPKEEIAKRVVVYSPITGLNRACIRSVLPRFKDVENRPVKWYMKGEYRDVLEYDYSVKDVDSLKRGLELQVNKPEENRLFKVECMKCVGIDSGEMGSKDSDLCQSLFNLGCK